MNDVFELQNQIVARLLEIPEGREVILFAKRGSLLRKDDKGKNWAEEMRAKGIKLKIVMCNSIEGLRVEMKNNGKDK